MIPLAVAMRDRGHDVLFATAASVHPTIGAVGLTAVAAGADAATIRSEFERRVPDMDAIAYEDRRQVAFTTLFADIAAPLAAPDLLGIAAAWRPDVVVHDVAEYAGPLVAARTGCPSVTHSFGRVVPAPIAHAAARIVAPLWQRHGVTVDGYGGLYGAVYLDICPPTLQAPDIENVPTFVAPLRPEFPEGSDEGLPDWRYNDNWRSVYVTLGTINNGSAIFETVLSALGNEQLNVIVTVGVNNDPAHFATMPPNVCIRRYVPQAALLPSVDAVICHGGSGTMLGSLAHGLPLVILPAAADQFYNADACQRAGVGAVLTPDEVTVQAIASATFVLLDEPRYHHAAQTIKREIAAMPTATNRPELIENLVSAR